MHCEFGHSRLFDEFFYKRNIRKKGEKRNEQEIYENRLQEGKEIARDINEFLRGKEKKR